MRRPRGARLVPVAALVPVLLLLAGLAAEYALARAGGGHSYSGSRGGGGRGGSFGGSGLSGSDIHFLIEAIFRLLRFLAWLTVHKPLIGIPLDLLVVWLIYKIVKAADTSPVPGGIHYGGGSGYQKVARAANFRNRLEKLKTSGDPNFSIALFNDFVYSLFSKVHQARGVGRLDDLHAYLSGQAIQTLKKLTPGLRGVQGVVVGSTSFDFVGSPSDPNLRVKIRFEANYTEETAPGQRQSWYANELWVFTRARGVLSRPPGKTRGVNCPACGAPPGRTPAGACPNCGRKIESGEFDWYVDEIEINREARPPLLTSDVPEVGTGLPTLYDPDLASERKILEAMDGFSWRAFQDRAVLVFGEIQKAWTARRWEKARPFETDNVFQTHFYWITEYQRQKLVNVLKDVRVQRVVPVRISRDKYFMSVTARIYASMIDYTRTEAGKTVCGSERKARDFSEYWTFVRSVTPKGAKAGDLNCPSCGAELKIGMSGNCEYCSALVTSGEFDWVLSQIEQDEAYSG